MELRVKELFDLEGESREFSCEITPEELDEVKAYSFSGPVTLEGRVFNRAGVVALEYSCELSLDHVCDRCVKEFQREYSFEFRHILVRDGEEEDDYVLCGNTLDLNELAISDILLSLPTKILCKEDCRGLCFVCGADLNQTDCGHSVEE